MFYIIVVWLLFMFYMRVCLKWGYPNSWMVYFMENPLSMIWGTPILANIHMLKASRPMKNPTVGYQHNIRFYMVLYSLIGLVMG